MEEEQFPFFLGRGPKQMSTLKETELLKIAIKMVIDSSKSWNATLPNKSYETYTLL